MKTCKKCKQEKPLDEFYSRPRAHGAIKPFGACKECCKADTKARWATKGPEYVAASRRRALLAKYGLTEKEYQQMLSAQGGRCAICQDEFGGDTPNIDHCHVADQVRGLLCTHCNWGIGHFRDLPERLEAAARYLRARYVSPNRVA